MTRREELIFLLDSYRSEMIDLDFFCREFYRVYFDTPKDDDKPTAHEDKFMKELAMMCGRYTADINKPVSFYTEKDLITKIGCWRKVKAE